MLTTTKTLVRQLMLGALAALLLAGCGGGNGIVTMVSDRPVIDSLSQQTATVGDQLFIIGSNFGDGQEVGSARLNGIDFVVNSWAHSLISVTVAEGMTSGTIVVTVNGIASLNTTGAELTIEDPSAATVVLTALNPATGLAGDVFTLTGQRFGADQGDGDVIFLDAADNPTVAEINKVDVGGVSVPQWDANLIQALVPAKPVGLYQVYVTNGTAQSAALPFYIGAAGQPVITDVTPANALAGGAITITGVYFGETQGESTLTLGALDLTPTTWLDTAITATVPVGALSGKITITVADKSFQWPMGDGVFTIDNPPVITATSPATAQAGDPLTIRGMYFGAEQGTGQVSVGGTEQPVSNWTLVDGDPALQEITIDSLLAFTVAGVTRLDESNNTIVDVWGNEVLFHEVVVTADNGLTSAPGFVAEPSTIQVLSSVDPERGQRSGANEGEAGTVFTFDISVTGGTSTYTFELIPDATAPAVVVADQDDVTPGLQYTWPAAAAAADEMVYATKIRVTDTAGGEPADVDGPVVTVVQYGHPLITTLALQDFNHGGLPAPNALCYLPFNQTYYDFTFVDGKPRITSSLSEVPGATALNTVTRDLTGFMPGGATPRGQGYRYYNGNGTAGDDGAVIAILGMNFGAAPGRVFLAADGAAPYELELYTPWTESPTGWTDTEIRFTIPEPEEMRNLAGSVQVVTADELNPLQTTSFLPLVCSPDIYNIAPSTGLELGSGILKVSGYDLQPPVVPGVAGTGIYAIWRVFASYTDPWTEADTTGYGLLTTPVAPSETKPTYLKFSLADLDPDLVGTVPIEVINSTGTEAAIVEAKLEAGEYQFFLWTGALTSGTPVQMALSGIFSEAYTVTTVPSTVNLAPVAELTADPLTGTTTTPVTLNASGSHDPDGTITDYQWDFNGNDVYDEPGQELIAQDDPGPHTIQIPVTTTVRVKVTDDDGATDIAEQTITINTSTGSSLTVMVTMRDIDSFSTSPDTQVRLYLGDPENGGVAKESLDADHVAAGDGNAAQVVFEDLPDGQYWLRLASTVMWWDDEPEPTGDLDSLVKIIGPYTVPPDAIAMVAGKQWRNPLPPS